MKSLLESSSDQHELGTLGIMRVRTRNHLALVALRDIVTLGCLTIHQAEYGHDIQAHRYTSEKAVKMGRVSSLYDQKIRISHIYLYTLTSFIILFALIYISSITSQLLFIFTSVIYISLIAYSSVISFNFFLLSLLFQSSIISLFSPYFESRADINVAQGINFISLFIFSVASYISLSVRRVDGDKFVTWLLRSIFIIIIMTTIYLLYGLSTGASLNAIIYTRAILSAPLQILFGYYIGYKIKFEKTINMFTLISILAIIFGYLEMLFPYEMYDFLNSTSYFSFKLENRWSIQSIDDVINFATRPLFNLAVFRELGINIFRVSGPNMHVISYAYFLGLATIIFLIQRKFLWSVAALFLLLTVQAKGILVVMCLSAIILFSRRFLSKKIWWSSAAAVIVSYTTATWIYGAQVNDYHVIGLMGGVNGFLNNPAGHGLGAGGNLAREAVDWGQFQRSGAASFGVESAVGVLLYQIGIGSIPLFLFFLKFSKKSFDIISSSKFRNYSVLPIMFIVIIFNGFFQEEAYNSFALGLVGFLSAAIISSINAATAPGRERTQQSDDPETEAPRIGGLTEPNHEPGKIVGPL